jgi:hypothetical protein
MNKKIKTGLLLAVAVTAVLALVWTTRDVEARGNVPGPVIFVTSQLLYYDSIVTADPLPPKGPFQDLFAGGPPGADLHTEFGPGDPGYVGGRWRGPLPGGEDHYFSCPLLGPGRLVP